MQSQMSEMLKKLNDGEVLVMTPQNYLSLIHEYPDHFNQFASKVNKYISYDTMVVIDVFIHPSKEVFESLQDTLCALKDVLRIHVEHKLSTVKYHYFTRYHNGRPIEEFRSSYLNVKEDGLYHIQKRLIAGPKWEPFARLNKNWALVPN